MRKLEFPKHLKEAERGQSLAEMAISMSILVLLVSGLLDLGRIYFTWLALEDAAGEAALFLAVFPYCEEQGSVDPNQDADFCDSPNNARWRAANAAGHEIVNWDLIDISTIYEARDPLTDAPIIGINEYVAVEIDYPFEFVMPLTPKEINGVSINPFTLNVRASQMIVRETTTGS